MHEAGKVELAGLRGFVLVDEPPAAALAAILDLALACLPSCDGASITLMGASGLKVRVGNHDFTTRLDSFQERTGEGPCATALRTATRLRVDSLDAEARWPRFVAAAAEEEIRSALALPLGVLGRLPFGVFNLYSRTFAAFVDLPAEAAEAVTVAISVTLANALAYAESRQLVEHLSTLLRASGDVVAQAQGILMEREGDTAEAALERMRSQAQPGGSLEEAAAAIAVPRAPELPSPP